MIDLDTMLFDLHRDFTREERVFVADKLVGNGHGGIRYRFGLPVWERVEVPNFGDYEPLDAYFCRRRVYQLKNVDSWRDEL